MPEKNLESLLDKATTSINELIQKLIEQGVLLKPDEPLNTNFAKATVNRDFVINIIFDTKFRSVDAQGVRMCLDDLTNEAFKILGTDNFTCNEGTVPPSNDIPYIAAELYFKHN